MDFDRLLQRHKDAVYRQLFRMCGNHEDAEDVLTQAMVNAFRSLSQLRDEEAFQAWLVQIGRRACGRLKDREAKRPVVGLSELLEHGIEPAGESRAAEKAAENELKECVAAVLLEVPAPMREIYMLRDLEGLSGEEASRRLGISLAAQKSRLHRARALVRSKLDQKLACMAESVSTS